MLMAERKGMRRLPSRSKRRSKSTRFLDIVSTRPSGVSGKAERAGGRLTTPGRREVVSRRGAGGAAPAPGAPPLHAAHQRPAPPVRRRVADRAKHRRIGRRVERAGSNLQGRLQGESRGIFQPGFVVFEGGAFLVLTHAGPQPPHQMGNAVEIHINKSFFVHHLSFERFCFRATRMRCGRCSSSSCRPTVSFFGATRSARRSAMPNTKRTVAYIPIATPGSPFSILTSVVRLMEARCAAIAAGMRRRRRASRMSRPSFRSAFLTGIGNITDDLLVLICNVHINGR